MQRDEIGHKRETPLLVQDLAWVVRKLCGERLEEEATPYLKRRANPKRYLNIPILTFFANNESRGRVLYIVYFHLVEPQ